ncbi:hypothetical protein CP960_09420 [Malaciobacter halophilus]|uniref:Uncharacterized protein n=1 Tax=Malaciobacter halophilus TaxID=197482 RepID=A0A2N1J1I8_9BACT|nr:hypothetical protein [Malaciobacter halophilus]AXH10180.1 hypothetical protein AHALO_1816 [Malaciobacter halophilus]PKI80418.1 hypothetical protein CP960_09420 [Malaciobacter halophilus]
MKLEYAGLKPMINEHGVSFKDGKEDKFVYLKYAIDILLAIDHEHEKKRKYSHQLKEQTLSAQEIVNILLKYHPKLEETINKEIKNYLTHLDSEEQSVEKSLTLTQIEKETFINNLEIMRDYKIQRAKNKIFYFHCIETIVEIILKREIKEIDTPFNERFWHILQTLEGALNEHKIRSDLKIDRSNTSQLKAMLLIHLY